MFYEKLSSGSVRCSLCSHRCRISPDRFGICGVRKNIDGTLHTFTYGDPVALHVDPIEKKPLYHFLPGTNSYSLAAAGCNFKCSFCQNWQLSQISKAYTDTARDEVKPEEVAEEAIRNECLSISYTYTEPTIFFEYAHDIAKCAKEKGIYNIFVTNGYMTKDALENIRPYLDAANVDLKGFTDRFYKKFCGARLKPVLESITTMKQLGIWVELTTLLIPGQNDSAKELKRIAEFIKSIGTEVPWHVSRFHPDYKYLTSEPTPLETLKKAYDIGKSTGLRYVYMGNVSEGNNTYCYNCGHLLVERAVFNVTQNNIKDSKCLQCGALIDGVFLDKKTGFSYQED